MVKKTAKKTSYPLIHWLAVIATPVFFACAHAPSEEIDGMVDSTEPSANTESVAQVEAALPTEALPTEEVAQTSEAPQSEDLEGFILAQEVPEATEAQIVAAQQKVNTEKPETVKHPFVEVAKTKAVKKPHHKKVVAAVAPAPAPVRTIAKAEETLRAPEMVVRNGSALNRYYFLRAGDSPEALSKLFYGSADRAADLVEWNGAVTGWEPGKVLYYRSGKAADDTRLLSYYFEAGVPTEEVRMLPGDTLRTLASQRLGHQGSWKEIAVLNP